MTPDQLFALPRDKAARILRRVMPANVSLQVSEPSCGEGGCYGGDVAYDPSGRAYRYALLGVKDAFDPEFGYYQTGSAGWSTIISVGDYGPPGDTVYGRFEALYTADGNLNDVRFVQMERSGSWFAEHIDTIGPLAVRLVAMAAGAGYLPTPADTSGAQMFEFFDAPSDFNLPADIPASIPGEEIMRNFYGEIDAAQYEWVSGSDLPAGDPLQPPAPPSADGWVSGSDLPAGGDAWVSGSDLPTGEPLMSPTTPGEAVAPPTTTPAPSGTVPAIPSGSGASISDVLQSAGQTVKQAVAALQTARQLWQAIDPRHAPPPGMASSIGRRDGTVVGRDAAGRMVTQRPPVGTLVSTGDGGFIVNHGDGTYSLIDPTGKTTRLPYGTSAAGFAGGSLPMLLIGGAALYFLMRKR